MPIGIAFFPIFTLISVVLLALMQHSLMDLEDLWTIIHYIKLIVPWERLKEKTKYTLPFTHFETLRKVKSYDMTTELKVFPGGSWKVLQPNR